MDNADELGGKMKYEVQTYYVLPMPPDFTLDKVASSAAGRPPDFSGAGCGQRDLGWTCSSEIESQRIVRSLKKSGFDVTVAKHP